MGGHKQIQIRLVTLIFIAVVIIAGIITMIVMLKNKGKSEKESNVINGINEMQESNIVEENTTADIELSFLKLENQKQNMIYSPLSKNMLYLCLKREQMEQLKNKLKKF